MPLYEEFALLNDYFTIQQYRYGGTITLDVSYIEDESLNHSCLIPRFTLQPLVENAIFHGIEPKGSAGEVTLRVERDTANGDVLIHLTDDGVGMTPEPRPQRPCRSRPRGSRRQIPPCGHVECPQAVAIQLWRGLRPEH